MIRTIAKPESIGRTLKGEGDIKTTGAYYTPADVARFLVQWAVVEPGSRVLDPSFGGGVFLDAACRRVRDLGDDPARRVFGIELELSAFEKACGRLHKEFDLPKANLRHADFFAVDSIAGGWVDAVVGNPPYVRYQRFGGEVRQRAIQRAAAEGVKLPELASSWAPFVIHSVSLLASGGRLAMVLPMELTYASYARPVLDYLSRRFCALTILTFRKPLFPDLNEGTLLLLADDRSNRSARVEVRDFESAESLWSRDGSFRTQIRGRRVASELLVNGTNRFLQHVLPEAVGTAYQALRESASTVCLGEVARVGIGYVTGANEFFHLSPAEATRRGIPAKFLRRAVYRGRSLGGLILGETDWHEAAASGQGGHLLEIGPSTPFPEPVGRYLEEGRTAGVHRTYKCRTRDPWYSVPHIYKPDAFLSYMSGSRPLLSVNACGAVAPNSLHIVRLKKGAVMSADSLVAAWCTSLVRLSCELEGRVLGGGMLKLEPGEAANVTVPILPAKLSRGLLPELDFAFRTAGADEVERIADDAVLRAHLGLSRLDIQQIRCAADSLRERRVGRKAAS